MINYEILCSAFAAKSVPTKLYTIQLSSAIYKDQIFSSAEKAEILSQTFAKKCHLAGAIHPAPEA